MASNQFGGQTLVTRLCVRPAVPNGFANGIVLFDRLRSSISFIHQLAIYQLESISFARSLISLITYQLVHRLAFPSFSLPSWLRISIILLLRFPIILLVC